MNKQHNQVYKEFVWHMIVYFVGTPTLQRTHNLIQGTYLDGQAAKLEFNDPIRTSSARAVFGKICSYIVMPTLLSWSQRFTQKTSICSADTTALVLSTSKDW